MSTQPPFPIPTEGTPFEKLRQIVAALRKGCPWDREQTHQSLERYVLEEAYEVAEAIHGDDPHLKEELGDLLLQVMLHSQIADERKAFSIDDVVDGLSEKMIRRHPHVFGASSASSSEEAIAQWEKVKAAEKPARKSVLSGISTSLPALKQAHVIGERCVKVGFEWNSTEDVAKSVRDEVEEFLAAVANPDATPKEVELEFGDILFTLAQLARKQNLDAEAALRGTIDKFRKRFEHLEVAAGADIGTLELDALHVLWAAAKKEVG